MPKNPYPLYQYNGTSPAGQGLKLGENIPGLDFFFNAHQYAQGTSLADASGWMTYQQRTAAQGAPQTPFQQGYNAGAAVITGMLFPKVPQPGAGPLRPKTTTPYTYQAGDDPVKLAQQYNTSPQAILSANPGGYPFTQGQTIHLPTTDDSWATPMQAQQPTQSQQPTPAGNTDYSRTQAAQQYARNNTPFLDQ